jgi:hypothetical protein
MNERANIRRLSAPEREVKTKLEFDPRRDATPEVWPFPESASML